VTTIVLSISSETVSAALVRRGAFIWRRTLARMRDDDLAERILELLRDAPRSRLRPRRVIAVVGPSGAQVRRLDGLPPTRDAMLLAGMVRENVARFFLVHGTPPVTTPVWRDSNGNAWCAAFDASLIESIVDACDRTRARLGGVAPVVALLPTVLADGTHVWSDGAMWVELAVHERSLIGLRRRRAGCGDSSACPPDAPLPAAVRGSARAPFVWRPRDGEARRRWRRWRIAALAAITAVAAASAAAAPAARVILAGRAARAAVVSLAGTRGAALAQSTALDQTTARLDEVERFASGRRAATLLLRDIATVLPDSTAIVAFRIDSAGGTFTAVATHAADVIAALADVAGVAAPRLTGAITRETTGGTRLERAAIRFRFAVPGKRS
jgi:hypothetical protein